ncbi:hypothetical protein EHO59_04515 [Leptospira semungkisensis]|uniref:Uncharacterized protein n=1 Tax=Leptospira semungkisensis TaxID=2484985 RepID=A0A4R9G6Z2_9LEPT|nr:hypothetical protein [Leptospira semungkisensis]TGK07372.1 hypothetical protein EHO59_04515 [Leptospira semungkisensis]
MKRNLCILSLLLLGLQNLSSAPLFFRTSVNTGNCFSAGNGSKEVKDFYKSKLLPEEKTKLADLLAEEEAKSLLKSLECIQKLNLSKEDKNTLALDHIRHRELRDALFSHYENHLLSDEKTIRLSAYEEKTLRAFLNAKKELLSRLNRAELESISDKPLPFSSFQSTYLTIFLQHWEFYQIAPDFIKEALFN